MRPRRRRRRAVASLRSEEHTSELQSLRHLVCRLLLEKKKKYHSRNPVQKTIPYDHSKNKEQNYTQNAVLRPCWLEQVEGKDKPLLANNYSAVQLDVRT